MTTETENPTWGEEPPPRADAPGPRWSGRKTLVAVAIAVGIAAVGGGVIYAASNSEAAQQFGGPRGYGGPGGLRIVGPGPFGDATHGEFQNGEVTAVTDDSVTVKSGDGFSHTYKIDDNTEVNGAKGGTGSLAAGDKVMVVAQDDLAKSVIEGDFGRGGNPGDGQGQPGQRPGDGQQVPPTR
ncbi:hypothetical protein [Saccharothrix variisporea]|uniref:DUF5666 domain-containing protein n=1 Tax=Saccharothrix variisporea TaxID=543527 RepID=A0A495X4G0_9PSEU|nr:hypothetical protein [Saccharothrix variisporea]RKT68892.1 hypothetical protein DFJ66_2085 [Saccharothrix variisporea]